MANVYTFEIDKATVRPGAADQALAWARGFESANEIIDSGYGRTPTEVFEGVGLWECPDALCGTFCSKSLDYVTHRFRLSNTRDSWSFVDGVNASISASGQVLGVSNV